MTGASESAIRPVVQYELGPTHAWAVRLAESYEEHAARPWMADAKRTAYLIAARKWRDYAEWARQDEESLAGSPEKMKERADACYAASVAVVAHDPERSNQLYVASFEWATRARALTHRIGWRRELEAKAVRAVSWDPSIPTSARLLARLPSGPDVNDPESFEAHERGALSHHLIECERQVRPFALCTCGGPYK